VAAEFGAGGYWVSEREVDLRFGVAAVAWMPSARRFGVSVAFAAGPGLPVDGPDFDGTYRELAAAGKLRFRFVHLPRFSSVIALGGAAHFSTLEGTLTADRQERKVQRVNGSVGFDTSVNFHVTSSLYLGASLGAAYAPTYRRYLVGGKPIFAPWPLTTNLTGYCGVELF
jgi:hypothetical protein